MIGPWLPAGIAAIVGLAIFVVVDGPVSRERLTKFANRHDLEVTTANAPHLVRYLALTRRWRAAGAVAGLTAYTVAGLQHQTIGISLLYGLAGWFAGAIVAEIRASAPATMRRAASLEPRSVTRYVSQEARRALPVATALCLVAVALWIGSPQVLARPLIAAIVLPALVIVIARRIAMRAQPVSSPDLLAADEAIRRNSSQALYAAATTLLLYAAIGPLLTPIVKDSAGLSIAVILVALPAIPAIGWWLGRINVAR